MEKPRFRNVPRFFLCQNDAEGVALTQLIEFWGTFRVSVRI